MIEADGRHPQSNPADTSGHNREATDVPCRICGSRTDRLHRCEERMFGTGEVFRYAECPSCGTLQLLDIPADLTPYYPPGYYSYGAAPGAEGRLERAAKASRSIVLLRAPEALIRLVPASLRPVWFDWFRGSVRTRHEAILDIGAGSGSLVTFLHQNGFTRVAGYDPFLAETADGPVPLYRSVPPELSGRIQLAMMHHSLEHTLDPVAALQEAADLLSPGGSIVVRVPLADSFAWRHYGVDWIQLDPPRHIFLLTERSVDLVARAAGLRVVQRWRDSGPFQFWGSQQWQRGISLEDDRSVSRNADGSPFTAAELQQFEARARELNAVGDGDTGCFILKRIDQ